MLNHRNLVQPRLLTLAMLLVSSLWLAPATAEGASAAAPETADSFVIGTGLVIGLPGTGDSEVDEALVEKSIVGVLRQAGLDPWRGEIAPGRIAKVIVTAELPPNADPGTPLIITVTVAGNATSLAGGMLLATPLRYTTGKVHIVVQGGIGVDGKAASIDGQLALDGHLQQLAVAE